MDNKNSISGSVNVGECFLKISAPSLSSFKAGACRGMAGCLSILGIPVGLQDSRQAAGANVPVPSPATLTLCHQSHRPAHRVSYLRPLRSLAVPSAPPVFPSSPSSLSSFLLILKISVWTSLLSRKLPLRQPQITVVYALILYFSFRAFITIVIKC